MIDGSEAGSDFSESPKMTQADPDDHFWKSKEEIDGVLDSLEKNWDTFRSIDLEQLCSVWYQILDLRSSQKRDSFQFKRVEFLRIRAKEILRVWELKLGSVARLYKLGNILKGAKEAEEALERFHASDCADPDLLDLCLKDLLNPALPLFIHFTLKPASPTTWKQCLAIVHSPGNSLDYEDKQVTELMMSAQNSCEFLENNGYKDLRKSYYRCQSSVLKSLFCSSLPSAHLPIQSDHSDCLELKPKSLRSSSLSLEESRPPSTSRPPKFHFPVFPDPKTSAPNESEDASDCGSEDSAYASKSDTPEFKRRPEKRRTTEFRSLTPDCHSRFIREAREKDEMDVVIWSQEFLQERESWEDTVSGRIMLREKELESSGGLGVVGALFLHFFCLLFLVCVVCVVLKGGESLGGWCPAETNWSRIWEWKATFEGEAAF